MQDGSIQLIVENKNYIQIISWILEAANYPLDKIKSGMKWVFRTH